MIIPAKIVFISERRSLGFVQHEHGFTTFQAHAKPARLKVGDTVHAKWDHLGNCEIEVAGVVHAVTVQYTFTTFEAALRAVAARKNRDARRHLRQEVLPT